MQKVINVIALLSGLTSVALISGAGYVLLNKDALLESVKEQATKEATAAISKALPDMIQGSMPKLPTKTGPVLDFEKGFTGTSIPLQK